MEKKLHQAVYVYLSLPLFIFLLSWLDYGWAILFSLLFGLGFYKAYQNVVILNGEWRISNSSVLALAGLAAVWCFFAGIGYFYYQSFDYHFRNAVFRDLINYSWPVMYDKANTPLVYYMAFWLVPAGLAKLSGLVAPNPHINFLIGNIYLFIYAVSGVLLIFLELATAVKAKGTKSALIAAVIFMLFSGLDIIGTLFFATEPPAFDYHLDWWAIFMQYSSITTGLFWVFNQFIPTALMILLIYNERNIKNFGFLIALMLFFSPYPAVGISFFMLVYTVKNFVICEEKKDFICNEIFSVQNIVGVFFLLPVVVLYFITNSEGMDKLWYIFDYTTPKRLIIFLILEVLLYAGILFCRYRKDLFFMTMLSLLLLIPFFRLDQQNNFCMRASISGIVILALYVILFLFECVREKKHKAEGVFLFILFLFGAVTPAMEFYRGFHYTFEAGKLFLPADDIRTLNRFYIRMPIFGYDVNHQYTAKNYRDDIFWQFFSKTHTP